MRNQLEQLRRFLLAKADAILDESESVQKAYKDAFAILIGQNKPACFSSSGGDILTTMDLGFGKLLVALEECGCANPNQLTVFEFYVRLDSLEDKYEANKPKPTPQNGKR